MASANHQIARPKEGGLDRISVPQLLAEAWRDRDSGWLRLARGKSERRIRIQDGSPISIESDQADDILAQTLEDSGVISPTDRLKAEKFALNSECPQASALLALRLIDSSGLYHALRNQTRVQLCETFEWHEGFYQWTAGTSDTESNVKPHDILALLQEELPRRWGTDRLFQALMAHTQCYGDIPPRFRRVAMKMSLAGKHAATAIQSLDGSVALGQILGECAGDPIAAATLWTLLHAGILRVNEAPQAVSNAAPEFEFEVEIAPSTQSNSDSARTNSAATAHTPLSGTADSKSEALRIEIETLVEQLSKFDHYTALGVSIESNQGDIKRAYFKAAKKFHPDALAKLGLQDLHEEAARVFGRIAEAFETLSDPSKKAAYDAGGGDEPEIDTARLAQAETSFRKGEILVQMGNFGRALEYLEPAVELWPSEPAYQSSLGWALYKQQKSDAMRAKEHLEKASSQAPDDAVILFRLGVVLRSVGETAAAAALIDRARSLEPSVSE